MENKVTEGTEKKLRNLKPFTKGHDPRRNLEGRPEGSVSIVEGIKRKLLEIEPANKKTYLELFLSKLFLKAIKEGNEQLMRDIINRVDGMPNQKIDANINQVNVNIKDAGSNTQYNITTEAETSTKPN